MRASRQRWFEGVRVGVLASMVLALGLVVAAASVAPTPAAAATGDGADSSLSVGRATCALTPAQSVKCWGPAGMLGDGTQLSSRTPVDVVGLPGPVRSLSASDNANCALTVGGEVWCWGGEDSISPNTQGPGQQPTKKAGLPPGITSIAGGSTNHCAVTGDGAVWCWGTAYGFFAGAGVTVGSSTPVLIPNLPPVARVSIGGSFGCALTTAGGVKCWGAAGSGQTGVGPLVGRDPAGHALGLSSGVVALDSGYWHTCAVKADGSVWCWGTGSSGEMGADALTSQTTPIAVPGLPVMKTVAIGYEHSCGLSSAGGVWCWGSNALGQLGNDNAVKSSVPLPVPGLGSGITAIGSDGYHSCALASTGSMTCWGSAPRPLGSRANETSTVPAAVAGAGTDVTSLASGNSHECAVVAGAARCWGDGASGELGAGGVNSNDPYHPATPLSATPVAVVGMTAGTSQVTAGTSFSCGLTTGGAVKCWGLASSGQLGNGSTINNRAAPVAVTGLSSGVSRIASGRLHSCALTTVGALRCWGGGTQGQLGASTNANASTSVAVTGMSTGVSDVAAGGTTTCAVTSAGAAMCWGSGGSGQLGNGGVANSNIPVGVTGLSSGIASVSVGTSHACAVTTDGAAWCWGLGTSGQLGDGGTTSSLTPVPVTGLSSGVAQIAAGDTHTCARLVDGTVTCWGEGGSGQLGNGATSSSNVPVVVSGLTGVTTLSVGRAVTCASPAGAARCWGENLKGQLGTGVWANYEVVDGGAQFVGANRAPDAADSTIDAVRGESTPITLLATDADADPLSFVYSSPTKGELTCSAEGSCTYLPAQGASGADSFTFGASDGRGGSDSATVTIHLVNTAPVAADAAVSIRRGVETSIVLHGSDPNGDALTFTAPTSGPSKGSLSCAGPACTYTSAPAASGTDSFAFSVDDGFGGSDEATVTIALDNAAPAAVAQALSAPVNTPTPITVSATDDDGDPLTYLVTSGPTKGSVTCDAAGSCSYRSSLGATGTDRFTFSASDSHGGSGSAVVEISLSNDAPVADPQTVSAPRHVATPITLTGSDPNGDALTFVGPLSGPSKGSVSCTGSSCSYRSDAGATGIDSFTFSASDGQGGTDSATVTIDLTNSAPVASPGAVTLTKGTTKSFSLAGSDPNGDPLTYALASLPDHGTVACGGTANATCTYTASGPVGVESLSFVASDPFGGTSELGTVVLTVSPPKVSVGDEQVLEPDAGQAASVYVPITLSMPASADTTVRYYTQDATASGGVSSGDYRTWGTPSAPRTLVIKAGTSWNAISVPIFGDVAQEPDQAFRVVLADASTADGSPVALGDTSGTVTIVDNSRVGGDPAMLVQDSLLVEGDTSGGSPGQFTIQFTKPLDQPVTLLVNMYGVTAAEGGAGEGHDFARAKATTLTIPAGTLQVKTLGFTVWGDTVAEADETLALQAVVPSGAAILQRDPVGTITLQDDD